jgi:hypothetical protein
MGWARCDAWAGRGVVHGLGEVWCMGWARCDAWAGRGVMHGLGEV